MILPFDHVIRKLNCGKLFCARESKAGQRPIVSEKQSNKLRVTIFKRLITARIPSADTILPQKIGKNQKKGVQDSEKLSVY